MRLPAAYWRLWTASTVSNLGDGIFLVALPLLAARLTRDEFSISLVGVFASVPWLLLSLPIGAIIDRSDRKRILIRSDTLRAVLVGLLAIVVATGDVRIWMLWILAFGLGVAEVFFDNASQAIIPAIVPSHQLERANGRRYAAEVSANIFVGTPLGAVLFGVAIWLPFGVDTASFVVAVALVITVRGSFKPTNTGQARGSLYADVRSGLRWLWGHRLLRGLAFALGLSNLGFQMSQALFVLYAQDLLHVSESYFGVLLGVMGVGAILGGILGDRVVRRVGKLFALYSSMCVWIVSLLAVGTIPIAWFVTIIAAVEAFAATIWNVVTVSLRQQIVPDRLFGRVNSVYRWFGWGSMPLGALAGGLIASKYGLRAPYFAGAASISLALVMMLFTVTRKTLAEALDAVGAAPLDDTPIAIARDPLFD